MAVGINLSQSARRPTNPKTSVNILFHKDYRVFFRHVYVEAAEIMRLLIKKEHIVILCNSPQNTVAVKEHYRHLPVTQCIASKPTERLTIAGAHIKVAVGCRSPGAPVPVFLHDYERHVAVDFSQCRKIIIDRAVLTQAPVCQHENLPLAGAVNLVDVIAYHSIGGVGIIGVAFQVAVELSYSIRP